MDMGLRPIIAILLAVGVSTSCESNQTNHGKDTAKKLAEAGDCIVKWTTNDPIPQRVLPNGGVSTVAFGSSCPGCEKHIEIRVSKNPDPHPAPDDVGDWAFCVHDSNPQYSEFFRLKRGDRVSFDY